MSYRRNAPRDPHWMTVRFDGCCHRCASLIRPGEQAFYYPRTRQLFCAKDGCGGQEARDFDAAVFDERQYQSQY